MKKLIRVLTKRIEKQIRPGNTNIIRIESFDDPRVYNSVCQIISDDVDCFIAKLADEKYEQFFSANKAEWVQALQAMHQGSNLNYSSSPDKEYEDNSYVDFNNAITKWRNESANFANDKTALVLLMGTEAATDTGGLMDTSYVVSPKEIISDLVHDYSTWFIDILESKGINNEECRKALHTFYTSLFVSVDINLFKLSNFIDELESVPISTSQELIDYICETLNRVWGIPSIIEAKRVPRVKALCKGTLSCVSIVNDDVKFFSRVDDIPSQSKIDTYSKQFERYAEERGINVGTPFPEDTAEYSSFYSFKTCVIDYMCGKNVAENRAHILNTDYAIIADILGTKIKRPVHQKTSPVSGEPVEALSKVFLDSSKQFYEDSKLYPNSFAVAIDKITLSNCVDDHKEEAFMPIAGFLGGILHFFDDASIEYNGELVSFSYDNDFGADPFDFSNFDIIKDKIKCTGKWGDPCKIQLTLTLSNGSDSKKYEYRWVFSPTCAWPNAFQYLVNVLYRDGGDSYSIPTLTYCENIQDYLSCESEDEFYAQLYQLRDHVLFNEHRKEVHKYFSNTEICGLFDVVCDEFKKFAVQLAEHGLFNALENLRAVVKAYSVLMNEVALDYNNFTDIQKEKAPLIINCFTISSNEKVLSSCDIGEAIVPAYNPVVLEKIDAKQLFIRDGFTELMKKWYEGRAMQDEEAALEKFAQLASITQGLDTIIKKSSDYITCKNMWEYYGVYYEGKMDGELLSGNTFGLSIVTDDEDASAMLRATPMSNIIVRNVVDYIHTFPARADGLNITFIAPADMQHIVSAIHSIAKIIDDTGASAKINVRIICLNSRKNSSSYLRKWLDNYFSEDRKVTVNTYLKNITISEASDIESIEKLLLNCDLCFNYNVLTSTGVQFVLGNETDIDKDQAKFPMTFTPDTIATTHGKARKVCISQFQFIASKYHAQAAHVAGNPYNQSGTFRTFKTLELEELREQLIEIAHNCCKWVVCVDPAIDRNMLEMHNSKIIGFTTGEGTYGELNVTVSARKDVLTDIKRMLKSRITEKFKNWDTLRLQKAADYCVDDLSQYMDGSRILKALNPYDYEIHNYLAYVLSLQMLNLTKADNTKVVRSLISLDSYKHWFADEDNNIRPDFMLIEIPYTAQNLDPNSNLQLDIKVIECKMGYQNETYVSKAKIQLEKGLRTMSEKWDPNGIGIMHRYWLNQLYRAIIFSPVNLSDASSEYEIIRNKIYNILSGKINIHWSGDLFAFWLDSNSEIPDEYVIDSDVIDLLIAKGIAIDKLKCHGCGQMFIQKMLLPPDERVATFEYNEVDPDCSGEAECEIDNYEDISATSIVISIPSQAQVIFPFIKYLDNQIEANRQDCMRWFAAEFQIGAEERKIIYESNRHPKWETVLDSVITLFRKDGVIENTTTGSFHLTDTGKRVLAVMKSTEGACYNDAIAQIVKEDSLPKGIAFVASDESECNPIKVEVDELESTKRVPAKKPLKDVRLLLGKDLHTNETFYWEFGNEELNNRHLLINGNSGCGKTYCIQALLMEAALQGISSVVFDYTGGFANSKLDPIFKKALREKVEQRIVKSKKIPVNPFAKHDIQIDDDIFVPEENADVADKIAEIFKSVYSLGDQQRSAIYSAVLNGLKIHGEQMSFPAMVQELENIGTNYAKTVISKIQAFIDFNPFTTKEKFNWSDIRDSNGTVYVFQLAGYGRDIQVLLTELLLWDIWSFCVKNGDESKPFVLVLDEAQNLSHGEKSPSAKILTEGRKFGLSGWYATQFMKSQLTDDEIQRLQQAGQKLYFCPPDDGVMTVAKNIDITAQGAKEWSEKLTKLKKGECVTCGSMIRNGRWIKYDPRAIKVTSLQERLYDE